MRVDFVVAINYVVKVYHMLLYRRSETQICPYKDINIYVGPWNKNFHQTSPHPCNINGMGDYVGICIRREKGEGKYEIDYATTYFHSYLQCMHTYTTL